MTFFRYRRRYLGQLCRLVAGLLKAGFKAMDPRGQPAFILYVQTFGDLVTFNPTSMPWVPTACFCPLARFRYCRPCRRTRSGRRCATWCWIFCAAKAYSIPISQRASVSGTTPDSRCTTASAPKLPVLPGASVSPVT